MVRQREGRPVQRDQRDEDRTEAHKLFGNRTGHAWRAKLTLGVQWVNSRRTRARNAGLIPLRELPTLRSMPLPRANGVTVYYELHSDSDAELIGDLTLDVE